jgi:hypothetical protein
MQQHFAAAGNESIAVLHRYGRYNIMNGSAGILLLG